MQFEDRKSELDATAARLIAAATELEGYISQIYNIIDGELASSWKGSVYDKFRGTCGAYKSSLDGVVASLRVLANVVEHAAACCQAINGSVAEYCNI